MRKNAKNLTGAFIILLTVLVLAYSLSNTMEPEYGRVQDFYGTSREVSLNEMVDVAETYNKLLYLPTELPNNLMLITIYLKDSPFIAIIVYSAEGNKDYKTAELTIQISLSDSPPTYNDLVSQAEDSEYETALEINNWSVLVNERANTGGNTETIEKYGEHILIVFAWIDGMRYIINCRNLMKTDAVSMVEGMCLLTE
jgi:hypothetical protein